MNDDILRNKLQLNFGTVKEWITSNIKIRTIYKYSWIVKQDAISFIGRIPRFEMDSELMHHHRIFGSEFRKDKIQPINLNHFY